MIILHCYSFIILFIRVAIIFTTIKNVTALAGVAQWIEHRPANQRVAGLIPSQGTCLDFVPGPQLVGGG